jgi:WD40 repeat protein
MDDNPETRLRKSQWDRLLSSRIAASFAAKQLGVIFPLRGSQLFQMREQTSGVCPQNISSMLVGWGLSMSLVKRLFDVNGINQRKALLFANMCLTHLHAYRKPTCMTSFSHGSYIKTVDVHPLFPILVTSGSEKNAKLWELSSNNPTCVETLIGHTDMVNIAKFHKRYPILVTSGWDRLVKLWKIESNGSNARCVTTLPKQREMINSASFHPWMMDLLVTGDIEGQLKLWKIESDLSGNCVQTLITGNGCGVYAIEFDQTRPIMITDSGSGFKVWIIDNNSFQATCHHEITHYDPVLSIALHPSLPFFVAGLCSGELILYRIEHDFDTTCVRTLTGRDENHGTVDSLVFDKSGFFLACGSNSECTAKIWVFEKKTCVATCVATMHSGKDYGIRSVAFHGDKLVTGYYNGSCYCGRKYEEECKCDRNNVKVWE